MITFKQFLEEQDPCWKGYRQLGTKKKNGKEVPNCIPVKEEVSEPIEVGDGFIIELENIDIETTVVEVLEDGVVLSVDKYAAMRLEEAEYQGRDVPLNKPMAGDVKKSKVFVKGPSGNVVKVNFGDKNMTIKKHIPERRKSFRARHNCDNPGPKHKARYWSCKAW